MPIHRFLILPAKSRVNTYKTELACEGNWDEFSQKGFHRSKMQSAGCSTLLILTTQAYVAANYMPDTRGTWV